MDMIVFGTVLFLLLIAGLFAMSFKLGRYGRGREREVAEVTRETALRDVSTPWRGDTGYLPSEAGRDPSPRDRLHAPEHDRRD